MGANILYRNVHTGLRQGKESSPLFLLCCPIPCSCSGPVPAQRECAIRLKHGIRQKALKFDVDTRSVRCVQIIVVTSF